MRKDRPPLSRDVQDQPPPHTRALDHLDFIRSTMARSATFTAVPGWGMVATGGLAFAAATVTWQATWGPVADVAVWVLTALLAFGIGTAALVRKAKRDGAPVWSGAGRKFLLGLLPSLFAGALLTMALLYLEEDAALSTTGLRAIDLLPALWLLLYGVAVIGAGMFSIRIIPLMGALFMGLGVVALGAPPAWHPALLALGFGGLHLAFGLIIVKRYGG